MSRRRCLIARSKSVTLREATLDDSEVMADIAIRNRADLEAVDPTRPEDWFSVDGQRRRIARNLELRAADSLRFYVIVQDDTVVGSLGISGIERGWFLSAHVGYLVDSRHSGRGVATAAVRRAMAIAFGELGLHRPDAGVLTTNIASQRVLEKASFRRVGIVERYLFLAGAWRDNYLYELVGPDFVPPE